MSAGVAIARLGQDFGRWDELLAMIRASFAYMDGVIDPPSSVHGLTPELLREKAEAEIGLIALARRDFASRPRSHAGSLPSRGIQGGGAQRAALQRNRDAIAQPGTYRGGVPQSIDPGEAELIGCAFLARREDHFYLGKLAVAPAWQGKGVGALLMKAAEEHALSSGKPVIELETRIELTGNQRLFARLGFAETGRSAHAGFQRPTSVTMRKEIA